MRLSSRQSILAGVGVAALALVAVPENAAACSPDAYMGTVCWTAAIYCPRQYEQPIGQTLRVNEYQAIYALIGNTWGGAVGQSFDLPNMQGREIIGIGQGPGLTSFPYGIYTGVEARKLSLGNMPSHSHILNLSVFSATAAMGASSAPADEVSPTGAVWAETTTNMFAGTANSAMAEGGADLTISTLDPGNNRTLVVPSDQKYITTMGPQLGLRPCVAMDGIFPPRD